jgi:hypothetical protein
VGDDQFIWRYIQFPSCNTDEEENDEKHNRSRTFCALCEATVIHLFQLSYTLNVSFHRGIMR